MGATQDAAGQDSGDDGVDTNEDSLSRPTSQNIPSQSPEPGKSSPAEEKYSEIVPEEPLEAQHSEQKASPIHTLTTKEENPSTEVDTPIEEHTESSPMSQNDQKETPNEYPLTDCPDQDSGIEPVAAADETEAASPDEKLQQMAVALTSEGDDGSIPTKQKEADTPSETSEPPRKNSRSRIQPPKAGGSPKTGIPRAPLARQASSERVVSGIPRKSESSETGSNVNAITTSFESKIPDAPKPQLLPSKLPTVKIVENSSPQKTPPSKLKAQGSRIQPPKISAGSRTNSIEKPVQLSESNPESSLKLPLKSTTVDSEDPDVNSGAGISDSVGGIEKSGEPVRMSYSSKEIKMSLSPSSDAQQAGKPDETRSCWFCEKPIGGGDKTISFEQGVYHFHCQKCSRCKRPLFRGNTVSHRGKLFCTAHAPKL